MDEGSGGARPATASASNTRATLLRTALAAVLALLIAAVGLELDRRDIALVDTLDKQLGDWRVALASPRAKTQRGDIALVMVTEETLLDYESRSPIDRALLAELVRAIDAAGPRAIALDIIFDRPTRHDARLIAALKEAKAPVVLGAIDRRVGGPAIAYERQAAFLAAAGKPVGHVMLAKKHSLLAGPDNVVRYVAEPGPAQPVATPSVVPGATRSARPSAPVPRHVTEAFVDVIARAAGAAPRPEARTISWLRAPADGPLFATLEIPRHDPAAAKPALEGIFPASWREILKGRVVLVGAAMIDRDQHSTPLSVLEGEAVPGVEIHAQAMAQRLDGNRDIRTLPWWAMLLVVAGVALACFLVAERRRVDPKGLGYGLVGLVAIGALSFAAFRFARVDIPSAALAIAWAGGGFGGFFAGYAYRWLGIESSQAGDVT